MPCVYIALNFFAVLTQQEARNAFSYKLLYFYNLSNKYYGRFFLEKSRFHVVLRKNDLCSSNVFLLKINGCNFYIDGMRQKELDREPEPKQMLEHYNRAWQKWQRMGYLIVNENKQSLYGSL